MSTLLSREYGLEAHQLQYGVKTVRQLRQVKKADLLSKNMTSRQKQKQALIFEYFRQQVDPIIQDFVTLILYQQPMDVSGTMLEYACAWRDGNKSDYVQTKVDKTTKAQRLYLATQVTPIITRIITQISKFRPADVLSFIIEELLKIVEENTVKSATNLLHIEETTMKPPINRTSQEKRPASSGGMRTPIKDVTEQRSEDKILVRPESAPIIGFQKPKPKEIQIALLGIGGAGKTSFINTLQGNLSKIRPTMGFRPITMMLGEDLKIKFYDLGGGKKIRDIWDQYYHDVHGFVYVIDASSTIEELNESSIVYQKVSQHTFLATKPGLILLNKMDKEHVNDVQTIKNLFSINENPILQLRQCYCNHIPEHMENIEENIPETDIRLENALVWLLDSIRVRYDELNEKLRMDTESKDKLDEKERLRKERHVLKSKIACAFVSQIDPQYLTNVNVETNNVNDLWGEVDGIKFLAGEIGVEVDNMDTIACEVAGLIGYQRLALQMIGAMNVPINKKKVPMSWPEIKRLVLELRAELGI
jgi:ADP-ribosylation factor-like protein 13B